MRVDCLYLVSFAILAFVNFACINCDKNATTTKTSITTTTTSTTTSTTTTLITTTSTESPKKKADTCTLNRSSPNEKIYLNKVMNLDKKQFVWEDKDHMYYFGVCTKAANAQNVDEAFVQINKENKNQVVIGRLNDVDLEGFGGQTEGIRIHYKNGDKYPNECNHANRNAVVYVLCNPYNSSDVFQMVEENHHREGFSNSCAYVFQLLTPLMCSNTTTPCSKNNSNPEPNAPTRKSSRLGFVSIIFLVILGVLFIYFTVGSMYMRYVKQARGIEQLPHHEIWQTIGARFSDCFSYICRCGKTSSEIRNYEHISDQLSDDDENLLNM